MLPTSAKAIELLPQNLPAAPAAPDPAAPVTAAAAPQALEATPPSHIHRRDHSNALVRQWIANNLKDTSSRATATRRVLTFQRNYQNVFSAVNPAPLYQTPLYNQWNSIEPLVTDTMVARGVAENRICHGQFSRLHRLTCGHLVYVAEAAACGVSCAGAARNNYAGVGASFHCRLCFRRRSGEERGRVLRRWHDALLPEFIDLGEEAREWEKFRWIARECEPAYVEPHGHIMLPRVADIMAYVRAFEINKEEEMMLKLDEVCSTGMGEHRDIGGLAKDFFGQLLRHHHVFVHAELGTLATVAVMLALHLKGVVGNYELLLEKFEAPPRPECPFSTLYDIARNRIVELAAFSVLDDFLAKAPVKYRAEQHVRNGDVKTVARRVWTKAAERSLFGWKYRWTERGRIMASCIQFAMKCYRIKIEIDEVMERLGVAKNFISDTVVQNALKHFLAGSID
ncbi:hypothetical protein BU26DRAFT_570206 [Trematosphaeria pertusa]|uniref:Uncharacterized protein n=1 Tax=Trematosphaeria pertusa TaxID=390896 RepID=A0A6A6HZ82_9PLEO|nr:uncharacterized protein BU26DRAFT_570206 [Trematosphaeria pertusa]KAF2243515.1 hypothetical protein BU26DRAFT_570206 [Trematosphaeria pertusa]